MKELDLSPADIASYFLNKSVVDGDLITNLKMQKLVYYAYGWVLALNNTKLFKEHLEAWPNGPVAPSLYRQLNKFGASPIASNFVKSNSIVKVEKLNEGIKYTLDSVYASYMPLSAFQLVTMTHNESPWKEARKGLSPTESSNVKLNDEIIVSYFSNL